MILLLCNFDYKNYKYYLFQCPIVMYMYTLLDARLSALDLGFYMFLLYILIKMNKQIGNVNAHI